MESTQASDAMSKPNSPMKQRGKRKDGMVQSSEASDEASEHREGPVARAIEYQTARVPSDVFLWSAFAAIAGSAFLMFRGRKQQANFVGQWAPTLLILGLYNKLVKVAGSDRLDQSRPVFGEGGGELH